jgi:hypothetical protein
VLSKVVVRGGPWKLAIPLAFALSLMMPATALADWHFLFSGQSIRGNVASGVDGYVRGSGIAMSSDDGGHIAEWIAVESATLGGHGGWVQIGMYQGVLGDTKLFPMYITMRAHVDIYTESRPCGYADESGYVVQDKGAPNPADYPVYVSWDGLMATHQIACADRTQAMSAYYFRMGSWSNAPFETGYMEGTSGGPDSELEVAYQVTPDKVNTVRFGEDATGGINDSHGLHLYNSGSWSLWSASTRTGATSPLVYVPRKNYSAYEAHQ